MIKAIRFSAAVLLATSLSGVALADPQCTTADKSTWQNADTFRQSLEDQGYKIKKFNVTDTNCYEIYGWQKDGKRVEIYYNPVDGKPVKEEIDD
ncbi:PepSY domain-containing protein [Marinobacter sp. C2H3]|uniref:PepSY domain-containing protein n=1 Tax=Marinobacter sp. C2H3 TaxID=3119003 RepID=UPI00300F07C9